MTDDDGELRFSSGVAVQKTCTDVSGAYPIAILVIEDDDVDYTVISRLLAGAGYLIDRATDLSEAKRKIGKDCSRFDLVVTDLFLEDAWPSTTFDELVAACHPHPLLIVSGYSRDLALLSQRTSANVEFFDKNTLNKAAFLAAVDHALRVNAASPTR